MTTKPAPVHAEGASRVVKPVIDVYVDPSATIEASLAAVVTRILKVVPYESPGAAVSVATVLPADIVGAAAAKARHVANPSVESWIEPAQVPVAVCATRDAGLIAPVKVMAIGDVSRTAVAP